MNEETYEALKRIVASYYHKEIAGDVDIVIIEDWIDETAKEHEQGHHVLLRSSQF